MPMFRLLHLSDFHIGRYPDQKNLAQRIRELSSQTTEGFTNYYTSNFSSYRPEVGHEIGRYVRRRESQLDVIVCTGDLATTGGPADLESAKHFLFKDLRWPRVPAEDHNRLALLHSGKSFLIMPGNHDRYGDKGKPGNRNFDLYFANYWATRGKPDIEHKVVAKDNEALAIISTDFCLKSESDAHGTPRWLARLGQGRCFPYLLDALLKHTGELKANLLGRFKGVTIVWAVHFPVTGNVTRYLKLIDAQLLQSAASKSGVQLLLTGHIHKVETLRYPGGVELQGGASCAVDFTIGKSGGQYMHEVELVVDLGQLKELKVKDLKWQPAMRQFKIDSERKITI
jgi:DNA repair exonuclease SbcCD nuclease subunit